MLSPRENFLRLYRHERPEYVPADGPFDAAVIPGECYTGPRRTDNAETDWYGVTWICTPAVGGLAPTPKPGPHRLTEIGDWDALGVAPTEAQIDAFDWAGWCNGFTARWDRENHLSVCFMPTGFFERLHALMGFENALCAFYDDPEALHAFLDAVLRCKKQLMRRMYEYARPDVLLFFDDYGHNSGLFLSKEMWRTFIAPRLREVIRYAHELGYLFEMHSCGYITPLVDDMVDMGIDALQPLQSINDVRGIKERHGAHLTIHGGITPAVVVGEGVSQAEIEQEIRTCVEICAPGGNFIPMLSECGEKQDEVSACYRRELARLGWDYR